MEVKTSIRIDFLTSLFHDGYDSRFIQSVSAQFCSRCRLRERMDHLSRLAGEQTGTRRDIRPVFESRNIVCSGLSKLCFPLREIFSVTQNRLPARGGKTPPKSSLFTGGHGGRPEILAIEGFSNDLHKKQRIPWRKNCHFKEEKEPIAPIKTVDFGG